LRRIFWRVRFPSPGTTLDRLPLAASPSDSILRSAGGQPTPEPLELIRAEAAEPGWEEVADYALSWAVENATAAATA
jgi:hypothetical protein